MLIFNSLINNEQNDETIELTGQQIDDILKFDESDSEFVVLPAHRRCMAHTFNLCSSTDLVKQLDKAPNISQLHKKVLKKCQSLWNAQNTSTVKADFIKNKLKKLFKIPCVTRWNSLYDALKDLLNIITNNREDLESVLSQFKLCAFTNSEIEYIKDLCDVFEPVAVALDIVQGENDIFCGIAIPLVLKTLSKLENLTENAEHCPNLKFLAQALINAVKKRFENILKNNEMQCATALLPKFKLKFFKKYMPEVVKNISSKLENEFQNILNASNSNNNNSNSNNNNNNNNNNNTSNINDLDLSTSTFFESDDEEETSSEFLKLYENYSSIDQLKEKKFVGLKKLFLKYNSAMPSSASVERLFSCAKKVLSPSRTKLDDKNFEMQLLLHENSEILSSFSL